MADGTRGGQVPLPPIPPVIQDLLDQLPRGPIQMPPNPDEVLTMLQHMIVPGRSAPPPLRVELLRAGGGVRKAAGPADAAV